MEDAVNVPSVAQRIPVEILEMIFLSRLPGSELKNHGEVIFPCPSTRKAPMVYSQICHKWRHVALSTPRLWAFLGIPEEWNTSSLICIKEWLRRSQSSPLSYQWTRTGTTRSNESAIMDQTIIKLLVAESTRWQQVIIADSRDVLQQLLAPMKCGVPTLEALEIHEQGTYRVYTEVDITAAPRLQYLNVTNAFQLIGISATQSVRHFILKEIRGRWSSWSNSLASPSGILQLFSTSPKLELVDISVRVFWMRAERPPRQITMPALQELSLQLTQKLHTPEVYIGNLLDQLTLPALKILSIDLYSGSSGGMPFSSIQSLIGRSHASLTSLSLIGQGTGHVMSENDLIDCIIHMPDLESLTLRCMPITDTFINALVPTPRSPGFDRLRVLCPVLVHITFSASNFSEIRVINMILSRWKDTNHPLLSVHLLSCNLSPSDGAGLQSFGEGEIAKKMGLVLEVDDRRA